MIFISKKRLEILEKRVADLEKQVQSQPEEIINTISRQMAQRYAKPGPLPTRNRFGEQV